jgi:hypothetical protein
LPLISGKPEVNTRSGFAAGVHFDGGDLLPVRRLAANQYLLRRQYMGALFSLCFRAHNPGERGSRPAK